MIILIDIQLNYSKTLFEWHFIESTIAPEPKEDDCELNELNRNFLVIFWTF